MKKTVLHAIECECQECLEKWREADLIMSGKTVNAWISVKDRLPKIHDYVLVTDGKKIMIDSLTSQNSWLGGCPECENAFGFRTHWMPLPLPPKE